MPTRFTLFVLSLFFPLVASAQVVFTEVMYDLETGSDSGREWVEIQNIGSSAVDVSVYRFREGTTNHALTISQGSTPLSPNGVAIIADNPAKFLIDNPNFSGTIFDSSFSLGNTGETLVLKDSALVDADQFTYSSDMGGNGDGKSLQKSSGSWSPALPTPGSVVSVAPTYVSSSSISSASSDNGSSQIASTTQGSTSTAPSGSVSKWPVKPQIYSYAGEDKKVTVGTPAEFEGQALGIEKRPLEGARYFWNFGDGGMAEGKKVLHTYRYPGVYIAVLDASSDEFSNSDKLIVTVVSADLDLHSGYDSFGGFIEVENKGKEEVDLSYWQIVSSGHVYALPKDSLLLPNRAVRFPENNTGLSYESTVELRYPNGTLAQTSSLPKTDLPVKPVSYKVTPEISPESLVVNESRVQLVSNVYGASNTLATPSSYKAINHKFNNIWLYALGVLLGGTILAVAWIGGPKDKIEIIEDPS